MKYGLVTIFGFCLKDALVISFDQFVPITPDGQDLYRLVAFQVITQPVDINIHGFIIEHIVTTP